MCKLVCHDLKVGYNGRVSKIFETMLFYHFDCLLFMFGENWLELFVVPVTMGVYEGFIIGQREVLLNFP